jgi:2-oxoglutarate dehydrogenase E1 component
MPHVSGKIARGTAQDGGGEQPLDWAWWCTPPTPAGCGRPGADERAGLRRYLAHRCAVLHDQNREKWDSGTYVPLQNIAQKQANFVVIDSLLSEEAVLGFEYGFATAQPFELVIWEAQFGDFANGAQVVIDQFIASGETKWARLCGLSLFLPHGYEGQGPEHSSARLNASCNCAEHNIRWWCRRPRHSCST